MRLARFASVIVLALAASVVSAQEEMVDNPQFTSWSKFKKGTSITLKTTSTFAGMTSDSTVTTTLIEVGADKLVLETSGVVKVAGMEMKIPPTKVDIPKKFTVPKGAPKPDAKAPEKPPGTFEEGTETLKIAGTEFKTKWYKAKVEIMDTKSESKVWMSDDVPGGLVKMEATSTGKVESTIKMELTEFKKP